MSHTHAASENDEPRMPTFGEAMGLTSSDDPMILSARETHLADVRSLWPVALSALIITPLIVLASAAFQSLPVVHLFAAMMGTVVPAIVITLIGAIPAARNLPSEHRIAALIVCGIMIAVSLSLMLDLAPLFPQPRGRVAMIVGLFGAIIVVAIALHPLRAALLAYAITLALMVPVTNGLDIAAAAAQLLAALLILGILRVARHDLAILIEKTKTEQTGHLATKLVNEFESNGTGWFWQTNRLGNLTYLSTKVANEIRNLGLDPMDERLTNVFRVDSQLIDTERTLTFHLSSRTSFSDYSVRPAFDGTADRWWSISGRPILDELGRFQGFIGSGSDLTEKRRQEAEITRLALFDSLTGLANRQRMRLSLEQTLSPQGPRASTLFLLDLDRFKAVNDTLGHQVGDELLKQVAQRLQRTVGDAGLVGRLGGDEFKVVLPGESNRDRLGVLARDIIQSLSQSYYIDGTAVSIGCSIGVAIAPENGSDAETLVRNADLALYAAKADGRGVHRFYRDELLEGAQSRKRLEDDLRLALVNDQFHLTYQPVVSTGDERIVGYEALLRWEHPTRGLVSPSDFIPVAEECGMIESIGEWVLRTAVHEAATWPRHVRVAVNVSPIQFANSALPGIVTNALASAGLAAERLELEITESVFLNDDQSSEAMFKALKRIGVRLALDDFGTGYSSLGYLKKAPFDKIKIDQSFVRGAIEPGNRNAAIIKAIVTLADTLYMETTAEGVEHRDEIALIKSLGCSHIQGYVYGRPARADVVVEQLSKDGGKASPVGYRVSRAPRTTMLRSARIEVGSESGEVRIRNMSSSGVMIDGVDFPDEAIGVDVLIELLENQLFPATIRWAANGKAGLEFSQAFNMERLNAQPQGKPALRRAG